MRIILVQLDMSIVGHGIRSLSSFLKARGHQVRLVFMGEKYRYFEGDYAPAVMDRLAEFAADCDFIGVSSMAMNVGRTVQVIERLKPLGKPIAWGGIFPTTSPEICIRHCDLVCLGEGEEALAELLDRLAAGRDCSDLRNFWVRSPDGTVHQNPLRPLVAELDSLPDPDYDPGDQWVLFEGHFYNAAEYFAKHHDGRMYIHGSRGCPFQCAYCCEKFIKDLNRGLGKPVRLRSVERIVAEMVRLKEQIPSYRLVNFTDSDIFVRPAADFARLRDLYNRQVKLPFWAGGSPTTVTREKALAFAQCGLEELGVGIQSGSDRVNLEIFERRMPQAAVLETARMLRAELAERPSIYSSGAIRVVYNFISLNPWETNADLLENLKVIAALPDRCSFYQTPLMIFPGTRLHFLGREEGKVTAEIDPSATLPSQFKVHWRHKRKLLPLYLNSVQEWLQGPLTRTHLGVVPRGLLRWLVRPGVVRCFDAFPVLVHGLNLVFLNLKRIRKYWRELGKSLLFGLLGERAARRLIDRLKRSLGIS